MKNHTPKSKLIVNGKMSTQAADSVGRMLALAALILASGLAVAAVIAAIGVIR